MMLMMRAEWGEGDRGREKGKEGGGEGEGKTEGERQPSHREALEAQRRFQGPLHREAHRLLQAFWVPGLAATTH